MSRMLDWYFDFVSPYSYLQCMKFPVLPADCEVRMRPVLFAGLLDAWGQKGPAEIPPKRRFTYRQVQWLADREGVRLKFPLAHPFNPLRPLRLAIALGSDPSVIREIFRFIWAEGRSVEDDDEWAALARRLGVTDADERIAAPEIKAALRRNGEDGVAAGVFGVPAFVADGEVFWGYDATAMLLDFLRDPAPFRQGEMARVGELPAAAERRR
jgi:2-hydroxychromene-2-carboxylate isomerase